MKKLRLRRALSQLAMTAMLVCGLSVVVGVPMLLIDGTLGFAAGVLCGLAVLLLCAPVFSRLDRILGPEHWAGRLWD